MARTTKEKEYMFCRNTCQQKGFGSFDSTTYDGRKKITNYGVFSSTYFNIVLREQFLKVEQPYMRLWKNIGTKWGENKNHFSTFISGMIYPTKSNLVNGTTMN